MRKKVICFGAGGGGSRLYDEVAKKYEIIGFTENDNSKIGSYIHATKVLNLEEALNLPWDRIVITSAPGLDSIKKQLLSMNIDEMQIDENYVIAPLESRRIFLEKLADMQKDIELTAAVAEAGVFEGDFAKWINIYYSNRHLYLFDTFEGFCEKDINKERKYSKANLGDYSNTSLELVMGKMSYKQNVRIYKGYFPDTARDIKESFCFVNLDLDLYLPTYSGLCFFEDKMVKNGVILIHDYFSENFRGPKEAVDQFITERNGKYSVYPIGDGISVMIVGF